MAGIHVSSKALGGNQKPGLAALTGLLQGLAQGMPIGAQIKNQRERTGLAGQELGIRGRLADEEIEYSKSKRKRLDRDEESSRKAAEFLQEMLGGGTMGPGGAALQNGARQNGVGVGAAPPSNIRGAPMPDEQGMAASVGSESLNQDPSNPATFGRKTFYDQDGNATAVQVGGQGQPQDEEAASARRFFARLQGAGLNPEDMEKVAGAYTRDRHLRHVQGAAQNIAGSVQQRIADGLYQSVDERGRPDQRGELAAKSLLEELARADPRDPQAMAAIIDKIEDADKQLRADKIEKDMAFEKREQRLADFQVEFDQRKQSRIPGMADPAIEEMSRTLKRFENGDITAEQADAEWDDARLGVTEYKKREREMGMRLKEAELRAKMAEEALTNQRRLNISDEGLDKETERKIKIKGAPNAPGGPSTGTPLSNIEAAEKIDAKVEEEFPDLPEGRTGLFGLGGSPGASEEERQVHFRNKELRRAQLYRQFGIPVPGRSGEPKNGNAPAPAPAPSGGGFAVEQDPKFLDIVERAKAGGWDDDQIREEMEKAGLDPDAVPE